MGGDDETDPTRNSIRDSQVPACAFPADLMGGDVMRIHSSMSASLFVANAAHAIRGHSPEVLKIYGDPMNGEIVIYFPEGADAKPIVDAFNAVMNAVREKGTAS